MSQSMLESGGEAGGAGAPAELLTPRQAAEALRQAGNLPELLSRARAAFERAGLGSPSLNDAIALCPDFEALALAIEADGAAREQLVSALTYARERVGRAGMTKISLQAFADEVLAAEYRQPLKTVEQACESIGWEVADRPVCCDTEVSVLSLLGPYHAECKTCGKFIHDLTGPSFSESGSVSFLDRDKVDCDTETRWISGTAPEETGR